MLQKSLNPDKELQSYIIGLALGDGNLSNPNKRAVRLRISCDKNYPTLYKRIAESLQLLLPNNKVSIIDRDLHCLDISVYSNYLETLLGWRAKGGSKFIQNVSVPSWIKEAREYKISCLRGLIETDGSIYNDRGYKMMIFTSIIPELANDFYNMIVSLGFQPYIYRIGKRKNSKYNFNQQPVYHVRLSKNVAEFLALVKPEKI